MVTNDSTGSSGDWAFGLGDGFWAFCSLTVDLGARPLSSGMFVGGADGVSDGREGLKQRGKEI